MALTPLKAWSIGLVITLIVLALGASPLIFVVLSTIGLPHSMFGLMSSDLFEVLRINPMSWAGRYGPPLLAGICCSIFYGAMAYFVPVVLAAFRSRKSSGI